MNDRTEKIIFFSFLFLITLLNYIRKHKHLIRSRQFTFFILTCQITVLFGSAKLMSRLPTVLPYFLVLVSWHLKEPPLKYFENDEFSLPKQSSIIMVHSPV